MSFGDELRIEREGRGVGLADMAAVTKVSQRHFYALEANEHAALPGGVFDRGIVRSYCRYLGLDEEMWLARFAGTLGAAVAEPDWAVFAENVRRGRTSGGAGRPRWWGVVGMAIVLAALAWGTWHFFLKPHVGGPMLRSRLISGSSAKDSNFRS